MRRTLLFVLALVIVSMATVFSAEAKKPVATPAEAKAVLEMLNSRNYWISITAVYPLKQRAYTARGYTIHVSGDTLQTVLPYVGNAFRAPLGTDNGMTFENSPIKNYQLRQTKRGGWIVTFSARTKSESCSFTFRVEQNGQVSVSLIPESCESISYKGFISKLKEIEL